MPKAVLEQAVAAARSHRGARGDGIGFGLELCSWIVLSHTHGACGGELCLLIALSACF